MKATIAKNEKYNSFEVTFEGKPCAAVRDMLKANGYRWHGGRGIWYGYKDIADKLDGAEVQADTTTEAEAKEPKQPESDKAKQSELKAAYMAEYARVFPRETAKFLEWRRGQIARVVELDGGELLEIAKPKIETDFCFGYGYCGVSAEGDYESAESARSIAAKSEEYFTRKNLKQLTEKVDLISDYLESESPEYCGSIPLAPYLQRNFEKSDKLRVLEFIHNSNWQCMSEEGKSHYRKPSAVELQSILTAYEAEIKAFEKRLQTYLKRYGLTKLHTWTYLSD